MPAQLQSFLDTISNSIKKNELIKLTLGNKRNKQAELDNVFIKLVTIKNKAQLSFVYRYPTKDITKNFDTDTAIELIGKALETDFFNADLFTSTGDHHLSVNKNGDIKLNTKPASLKIKTDTHRHDKQKERNIKSTGNTWLNALGITSSEGHVKKEKQDKYKQINHYVEIIEGILKDVQFQHKFSVADMGSGKGYLTFALYDYLHNTLKTEVSVTGIEIRNDLVEKCNRIAVASNFNKLSFQQGSIEQASLPVVDMLIALHACDTATDEAIYKGISANAKVIVCAPCCHKQIRKQMKPDNALHLITRHGILLERQAEMATDSIRALVLEAFGYKTKVFEFISTEHTPKNVLIAGVKKEKQQAEKEIKLAEITALKKIFGIKEHHLEKLLGINK